MNTLIDKIQLKKEINRIKKQGYSISYSENFEATVGMSYPIYDYEGKVIAAIGVSIPDIDQRLNEKNIYLES